jgi:hypothetical protein
MNWLFSQALVEEYSADTCSDGEPYALSSGSPTPQAYLSPDKMTEFSRLSRFGMTFKPLTAGRGEELLTLYLEGFHAKTYQRQAKNMGLEESAAECGEKWRGWLAKYDPDSCSWKTAPCLLGEGSRQSLVTWPRWGLMRDGECWEQPTLVPRTKGTGSGLWLTPQANEDAAGTPKGKMQRMLGNDPRIRGTTPEEWARGTLNPTWVEWLMGWPLGWTDSKPLATDKFRQWQHMHFNF